MEALRYGHYQLPADHTSSQKCIWPLGLALYSRTYGTDLSPLVMGDSTALKVAEPPPRALGRGPRMSPDDPLADPTVPPWGQDSTPFAHVVHPHSRGLPG